ncbi:gliding motility-associated C-terminal domain-containing protein, partial [Mariniflexile sp. AS56]
NVTWSNDYGSDASVKCDNGAITVTFTATDVCGNRSTTSATYLIKDNVAPVIDNTAGNLDATLECSDAQGINDALDLAPTATDDCSTPAIAIVSDETTVDPNCTSAYVRVRVWNFVDACGNTSSNFTQTITVQDTTAPVLTLPANVSAECSDDLSPIAFGTATATDNCDDSPSISYEDVKTNGNCSGTYTITRTWKATDACGNEATANQIISTSDTTAPEFAEDALPGDITVECTAVPVAETLTATDNCGTATVTVNDIRTDGNCANNYMITRTWTATDECGLTKTHIQTITVQDTTAPTFVETTLPPVNLVVECDAVPTPTTLTAIDACGTATVTVNDVRTNGNCANNYALTRTWTATDACGNTAKHTQIIIVQDTQTPKFVETSLPANVTVECDAVPTAQTLTATDNCGSASVTSMDVVTNGDCPNNYIIARTWTATDECGLKTTHTQMITVQDTKAPTPATTFDDVLSVSCTNIPDAPALTFTDSCSSTANIVVVYEETTTFEDNVYNDYEIVRTWTVRDECGNEANYKQTLSVSLDEEITDIVALDRCFDDGIVNLNDLIPSSLNTTGTWELIQGNPVATLTGNIFNPTTLELSADFLPDDGGMDYKFRYTTTDNGCISITDLTMNINADCKVLPCGENDVLVSKAVTPNGDAYNEFFKISGIDLCGFRYDVKIFNRWGALIYESNDYQNDWNGTASKKSVGASNKVPNGTYYYIITLKDSGLAPFTGPVYLGTK